MKNIYINKDNSSYLNSTDLELALAQKDIEISQLKEHIQKLEQHLLGETNLSKNEINSLKEQLQIEVKYIYFIYLNYYREKK